MENLEMRSCLDRTHNGIEPANLVDQIQILIGKRDFDAITALFDGNVQSNEHLNYLKSNGLDLFHQISDYLNDITYQRDYEMFCCAENILKIIANYGPADSMVLELLELIEPTTEFVFTIALHALQIVLLRIGDSKPRALEWTFGSVLCHLEALPLPKYLERGYDEQQQALLEQDNNIQNLLMRYVTVNLFTSKILEEICSNGSHTNMIFRDCGLSRRNLLCCFLVKLLGRPLALLDLKNDGRLTNSYTMQCAKNLIEGVVKCISDPIYFLTVVEKRIRWRRRINEKKGVFEMSSLNIFFIEDKLPVEGLTILYYLIFVEGICFNSSPKIYSPIFLFESGLYLIYEMFNSEYVQLHYRCLLLVKWLLVNLGSFKIPTSSLEIDIHKHFCNSLCNIMGYSPQSNLRETAIQILRDYIEHFEDCGKYIIVRNLMKTVDHTGIKGFLLMLYKDIVANSHEYRNGSLPMTFSKKDFRKIVLKTCTLPMGETTNIIENADQIIPCLNILRFFVKSDSENRTGIWDFYEDIERKFIIPLRMAINLSVAHFKAEHKRLERGEDVTDKNACESLNQIDIKVMNDPNCTNLAITNDLTRENKLSMLNEAFGTFELIRFLIACIEECKDLVKSSKLK